MHIREKQKTKKEIKFEDVHSATIFEMASDRGNYYIKGCDAKGNGVYALNLKTGIVTQPLMENSDNYNHLYIYPGAVMEV